MLFLWILGGIVALALGIWIGVGAPGIRHEPRYRRRHESKRSMNPIAWGRTPDRERRRPSSMDERRDRWRGR